MYLVFGDQSISGVFGLIVTISDRQINRLNYVKEMFKQLKTILFAYILCTHHFLCSSPQLAKFVSASSISKVPKKDDPSVVELLNLRCSLAFKFKWFI